MDELTSGVDPDELMDLDEAEASDLDEDDEDVIDDPMPSPLQLPSSGPASTATSTASSPPTNDDTPPVFNFTGKPLSIKRGRGRPRREGGKPAQRRQSNGARIKRWRQPGYSRGVPRRVRSFERGDFEFSSVTPSPGEDTMLDSESGALIINERHAHPTPEEVPYAPEQWPGKVCAFCNLGERSQLGQGEMLRLTCPEGFTPQRIVSEPQDLQIAEHIPERDFGDKSPRGPVTCRRQKSFNKCRHPSLASEYVDELTIIGYIEEPVMTSIFEITGHFYVHRTCAMWSNGVVRTENLALDNVGQAVLLSLSKKCSHCSHFGASVSCKRDGCSKVYHYPCSTASGAFQEVTMLLLFCTQHLSQVSIMCESSVCYTCKLLGDISNLMYCSLCGEHYHGTCVGLAQLPGVRAGWQCRRCRVCQVCRMSGDESKLMACEQCDKGYHSMCQRPTVATIPKYGWKCRCCRVCGDCGSRTPGAGLSSRWHAHYTVCDSCYQQRNKGFSCPLCHRAYRAHAHREMVQCAMCRKFVHGTCDPDADLGMYHQRKETNPEYEYVCSNCKNITQGRLMLAKRNSIDDGGDSMSASQESLIDDYDFDVERCISEETVRSTGLGRGKPYSASKIAKKRLGIGTGAPGRPKGVGKGTPGKVGFMKRQRMTEFGRKRGPKTKMRGIFGVPGVGLQRPVSDGSKNDEEPGIENRLILCSAKDKFVLTQDMCVMCGALGTDQEGCLISCVQCGQCYHPYCVNVKVTKVILQKGWRCLDCTVCEGCGQRHDESRLILCDDCDISFHIYCMDPPLDYVPDGNWKCKWCALCQTCGTTDPGFNSNWMNSFTECGPCASHVSCPSCLEPYIEGDLIMQCVQCERWLHGACDSIKNDLEAEKCAEEGYNCVLCRPADVPPPHLLPCPTPKPPTPTKSPEVKSSAHYYVDGVYLSETGHTMIKSLCMEQQITRKKRKKMATLQDKEAGIMATIESVIAGSSSDNGLQDNAKLELVDVKEEPQEIYKEGMIWTKEDGPPPEGFTIFTMESGVGVLRRKRQRNLQKLGIGGFLVRVRGIRGGQDNDDIDMLPGQTTPLADPLAPPPLVDADKPRRKPIRRKPKSKLSETFPSYLQEAFFGRELLDSHKDFDSSSGSDEERGKHQSKTIQLSQDEMKAVAAVTAKQEKVVQSLQTKHPMMNVSERTVNKAPLIPKEEEESDPEDLSVLALSGDLLVDTDLVNTIMNEDDDELAKTTDALDGLTDSNLPDTADITETLGASSNSKDTKDELSDILGPHFNLDIPNINSKDVEDIFKGVLTDESQESQESNVFPITATNSVFPPAAPTQQPPVTHQITPAVRPTTLPNVTQNNLNSPMSFPPQSPYHSEYSNSPQFSPAFSEPPSPWVSANDSNDFDNPVTPSTHNQRSSEKMKADEGLGSGATISAVLYANMNHPEWKSEFPAWSDRYKQIIKKWRTLSNEHKAPYLQQAKDNRSALRMKKQQQISKESASSPSVVSKTVATPAVVVVPPTHQAPAAAPVSEVCTHHHHHNQRPPLTTITTTSSVSVTTTTITTPPTTPRPASLSPCPQIQHQFTVHGPFLGPGDHCGPAPNVTVNPLYQPNTETPPRPIPLPSAAADQQIRVLTPSEIMRTLPSLCQETYEPQSLDPEKTAQQIKSAREAEQERNWKHLQAMRQQQQQQQQNVIQEQRVQVFLPAIARVHRQISDPGQPFISDQVGVLQVTTQEINSAPSSPSPRNFNSIGIKSPTFTHPASVTTARPTTPSPQQQQPSSSSSSHDFLPNDGDPFSPKPLGIITTTSTQPTAIRLSSDSYPPQPSTPRPQFSTPRPALQGMMRPEGAEINRQLRDLLQRQQQFKKLDEQLLPGKGQQRVWPPPESLEVEHGVVSQSQSDATFRHPLPPSMRPRIPVPQPNVIRQQGVVGLRMQVGDSRLQGLDPRMKLIIQHQQRAVTALPPQQQFQGANARFQLPVRPALVEQYEHIQRQVFQPRVDQLQSVRLPNPQVTIQKTSVVQSPALSTVAANDANSTEQEIPDNVTAELEKLEQDGGMVELQSVGDILGGLPDDDDELLAEMGNDFNILEYADPELDALTGGEKTNILDTLDLVEPEPVKEEKKASRSSLIPPHPITTTAPHIKTEPSAHITSPIAIGGLQPPPLTVSQLHHQQQQQQAPLPPSPQLTQQQIHQQMLQQVQQAAALGRPIAPGTKLMSPDGIIGTVTPNNNVTLKPAYNQRLIGSQMQLQNQKQLQMRLSGLGQGPRLPIMHGAPVGMGPTTRMNVAAPPPPPYPGPPPPYPGSTTSQTGLRMGPAPMGPLRLQPGPMHHVRPQGLPMLHPMQRRPLLLEDQPLLLEDLLEQEKREQEKQLQIQPSAPTNQEVPTSTVSTAFLNDHDFERLKADVFNSGPLILGSNTAASVPAQGLLPVSSNQGRQQSFQTQATASGPTNMNNQWQAPQAPVESTPRVPTYNANLLPAPPLPPEHIVTDQDKQTQMVYEQWLKHQNAALTQQLKFYETEVQKLRKIRKSLNSKQRGLRKSGNQLGEADAMELQRISAEQGILQKQLESSRKQFRQHGMLMQEYRNKQQAKQRPGPGQSPLLTQSPLGPPASSPIHSVNTPQSPLLSPSASPMMQHSSPMHSPAPIVSHSPGPGSVSSVLQSPNNQGSSMSPMQQSPRIGTPHSQSDGSPGPVQSPSQICLPPPAPRMTSPQHRRVVTSPIAYVSDMRPGTPQLRFTRPSIDTAALLQQRTRLLSPTPVFQQKPGTSSPLNSPPSQQMSINQQFLQRHLQQQALLQQQQQQQQSIENHSDGTITHSQRTLQMIQQRQIALRQQIVQGVNQPQPLTPHQHQLMVQQQQQLAKQQQQQIAQLQVQRISQHSQPPSSPMPPSPLVSQPPIMSPHSMHSQPASPMPPRSPMISHSPIPRSPALHQSGNQPPNSPMTHLSQPPSSPMPRSPMIGQIQSPMAIRRPPSTGNSPALPDRPKSVENPGTPRTPYTPQHLMEHDGGGGNPHNPSNPMPLLPGYFKLGLKGGSPNELSQSSISSNESKPRFGRFGYIKLGLRGGSPMWAYGRGAKRLPTEVKEQGELRQGPGETPTPPKFKKESHLSKVSILKKKSPIKSNLQALTVNRVNSLVSSDYNEFDDSSSTPPVTPPPTTSKLKPIGKKIVIDNEHKHEVIDGSPEGKHMRVEMMDYDDDAMVVSTEVSLSAAAQQTDGDDIIESFAQTDLPESFSSPLESDDITDDFLLFDISEGVHYSDKEDDGEEYVNINDKNMHIVFQSPTTSDEELIQGIQGKNKSVASDDVVGEAHERENEHQANDSANLSVVIVDPSVKSPEEISTKEDFEELIDEGSRKEKIIKSDAVNSKHINEIHKYAANVYSFPPKNAPPASTSANAIIHANILSNIKSNTINIRSAGNITGQKILMTPVIKNSVQSLTPTKINLMKKDVVITTPPKLQTTNLANIILPLKTTISSVRSNVINVPKLVTSVSPAITIVSASTSQIASILPSHFTVPVLSASAVSKLPNVKVIEKPSTSLSLTTHDLPKKIFEDDSKSPDSSNCDDDRLKLEQHVNKIKDDLQNHEVTLQSEKRYDMHERQSKFTNRNDENENLSMKIEKDEKLRNLSRVENMKMKEYRVPSPVVRKNSPLIIHNPPELKMTAQVIQESQGGVITSRTVETMPFITTQTIEEADGGSNDKSVVISIPSPTPSQEQMLDNIALQALETRRQDGKYEYFDVLEMFEDNLIDKFKLDDIKKETPVTEANNVLKTESKKLEVQKKVETQTPVTVSTTTRPTVMPQLSPLSQPTELTTNMANVSQQLRTLLSSLNTTTVTTSSNVETVVTNITYKEKVSSATLASTISPATSRMVQPERISPVVSTTVIVPNKKVNNSPKTSPRIQSPVTLPQNTAMNLSTMGSTSVTSSLSISNLLPTRIVGGIQLMPDHPKLPPVAKVNSANVSNGVQLDGKTSVVTTLTTTPPLRKTSLSLNDMLQSHPAATMAQSSPGTITTASILGSPLSLSKSGFSAAALAQAQPHVVGSPVASTVSLSTVNSPFRPVMSTTNLLHSQLTKGAVSRTKSLEDMLDKKKEIKLEVDVTSSITTITTSTLLKQENSGCKFSSIQLPNCNRIEDSQNVLLKQLLQNTACAGGQNVPTSTPSTTVTAVTAPALPIIPNLEAQLARPVPPTPSSLIPPILQNDSTSQSTKTQRPQIMSRETSFVSKPIQQPQQQQPAPPPPSPVVTSASHQLLHIDVKKSLPPSRTPSRDDLLSPPTPRSSCSQDSNLTTPPLVVKKEPIPTLASPLLTPQEVKKEFVDETSQHSEISDLSRYDVQLKEEMMDIDTEKSMDKEEVKKMKRRMYQQKRRQNQIMNKEVAGQPKKRPRKSSKVDEDYDAYVDGILAQMRNLPPMVVSEPVLNKNFAAVPVFGSGDLLKLGFKDYDSRLGDLNGMYGNALVPGFTDYYTTKPYGDSDPLPEKPPASTQRGFYDQEFSLICFDSDDDKRFDLFCRDDTPDSVISSSSPECPLFEPVLKFPGLKLIDEEDEDGDEEVSRCSRAMSPIVPIVAPIPIRLKPAGPYLKDYTDVDKENIGKDYLNLKSKFAPSPTTPLKDSGNVTVTLTLTSSAAEDIMGVLRDLANILHIPAPTSYQIVERTSTPPSQKLGLYRTKGKDGKEGAPIDIQSILNGAAKFCKHCDVVILSNMIRKKIAELPFLSKDTELLGDGEELFFCSSGCYTQFALMHRSPSLTEDKAAAIVDHICQRDKADLLRKRQVIERQRAELFALETVTRKQPHYLEKMDIDLHIKKEDFSDEMRIDFMKPDSFLSRFGEHKKSDELHSQMRWKNVRYKHFTSGCLHPAVRHKKPTDKEIMELLYKLGVTVVPVKNVEDTRKCMFCHNIRDGVGDGPARLLNFDVDKWVHLNCGLWSDGVYETVNGALMNLENALQHSLVSTCILCSKLGATLRCFKARCTSVYHLSCAIKDGCVFYKNKTMFCTLHIPKGEKDNELTTLSVSRRVYVNRDENRQVAAVMHHSDQNNLLRVGSLIFLSVGQLLPHQLQNFHTSNFIYPIGYKIIRFYWSMRHVNKRCRYVCSIHEVSGRPEFRILAQEMYEDDLEFRDITAKGVWNKVLESIAHIRRENQCVQIFPKFVTGEDLFGLTEPAVVRVLESLPGIETLTDYKFKYGRNPLLELPLAINPSGAARTEPRLRNQLHWKRAHTQRTGSSARPVFVPTASGSGEAACPYSKQFVHSKSSQYKKMKQEWRNNVYLARSKIQGLGLYAARDLEKHTMVIEYIGEIIRTELAETREKQYEARNRGIYMFRLDEERVVDATLCGGLARYINHSCNPNCVAEIVEVDRDLRIIIFAKRRIQRGEELAYDYKFDIEDDQHKISCMCGAPNCRKWMN